MSRSPRSLPTRWTGGGRRRVAVAGGAVSMLLLAACGTTVPHDQVVAANGGLFADGSAAAGGVTTLPDGTVVSDGAVPGTTLPDGTVVGGDSSSDGGTSGTGATAGAGDGGDAPGAPSKPGAPGSGGVSGEVITASCGDTGSGTIKIGNVGPYSASGAVDTGVRKVMAAWQSFVNANGGICGRQVEILIKDDKGSAASTSSSYKELIETDKVSALIHAWTATNLSAYQSLVESNKIPVVGGADLSSAVFFKSPYFFAQAAPVVEAAIRNYQAGTAAEDGDKVAILYCSEVGACEAQYKFEADNGVPELGGAEFVYAKKISLTQVSFAAECQAARDAGAGVILAFGDTGLAERVANSCAQQGLDFSYITLGASEQMRSNEYMQGRTYSSMSAQPWVASGTPGIDFYHSLVKNYGLPDNQDGVGIMTTLLVLQQAITSIGGGDVTPASIQDALESMRGFDAGGLTSPLSFSAGGHVPARCTGSVVLKDGDWVAVDGGKLRCRSGAAAPLPSF